MVFLATGGLPSPDSPTIAAVGMPGKRSAAVFVDEPAYTSSRCTDDTTNVRPDKRQPRSLAPRLQVNAPMLVRCCRGVGNQLAPGPNGVRSRSMSDPGIRTARCTSVRRPRSREALVAEISRRSRGSNFASGHPRGRRCSLPSGQTIGFDRSSSVRDLPICGQTATACVRGRRRVRRQRYVQNTAPDG
jgi:hypothetical protein